MAFYLTPFITKKRKEKHQITGFSRSYFFPFLNISGPQTILLIINPVSAKITRWPNTLKQFVGNLPTNCLSVFDHFVGLTFKRLISEVVLVDSRVIQFSFFSFFIQLQSRTKESNINLHFQFSEFTIKFDLDIIINPSRLLFVNGHHALKG